MGQANDARSYDLVLDLCVDRPGPSYEPNPLKRRGVYNLSQQCFKCLISYSIDGSLANAQCSYSFNPDASLAGGMPGGGYSV